ncbi:hypothetical protein GCM10028868_19190 [Virgibacillus kimchii]
MSIYFNGINASITKRVIISSTIFINLSPAKIIVFFVDSIIIKRLFKPF